MITVRGAVEKSQILLLQYKKKSQYDSALKMIFQSNKPLIKHLQNLENVFQDYGVSVSSAGCEVNWKLLGGPQQDTRDIAN